MSTDNVQKLSAKTIQTENSTFLHTKKRNHKKRKTASSQQSISRLISKAQIQGSKIAKGLQNFKVLVNWDPFCETFFEKKSHNAEKTEREVPFVSSGIVCYAGNLFGSIPWANSYILASSENFVELLVEIFWSVQVVLEKH